MNGLSDKFGATPYPILQAHVQPPGHYDEGSATHRPSQIYVPKSKKT